MSVSLNGRILNEGAMLPSHCNSDSLDFLGDVLAILWKAEAMGSQAVLNAYLLYDPVSKHFPQSPLFGKLLRNRAGNHGLQNARFFERTTTTTKKIPQDARN